MENGYKPVQTNQMPASEKIANILWGLVNGSLFRITPAYFSVFRKLRVGLLNMFGAHVSYNASIHPSAKIDYPWRLKMGDYSSLGKHSWAYCLDKICIGENSCIGQDVYLLTGSHDVNSPHFDLVTKPVSIGSGVWVSTGCTVLPGVVLADMTVVGAGAVVTKSTEESDIIGGNPAKFIKKRDVKA